jgi:hypothetical protein
MTKRQKVYSSCKFVLLLKPNFWLKLKDTFDSVAEKIIFVIKKEFIGSFNFITTSEVQHLFFIGAKTFGQKNTFLLALLTGQVAKLCPSTHVLQTG